MSAKPCRAPKQSLVLHLSFALIKRLQMSSGSEVDLKACARFSALLSGVTGAGSSQERALVARYFRPEEYVPKTKKEAKIAG